MKKILLIDNDQKFIGDLQTKLARRYELLTTEDYKLAYRLLKTIRIDLMIARLPPEENADHSEQLKKLLNKLNKKKFASLTKILIVPKGGDYQVEEFLKLGIAAVVVDVEEVVRWIG